MAFCALGFADRAVKPKRFQIPGVITDGKADEKIRIDEDRKESGADERKQDEG